MKSKDLYNKEESKIFYESRYENGYMDEWPDDQKHRVFEIVRSLSLIDSGSVVDFGCGNGVFTDVLRQALPGWKVFGCDISEQAILNAQSRFPQCSFFVSDETKLGDLKFDFLFSHHVLEHVFDINKIIKQINNMLHQESSALLILPCGNEGSLEYQVSYMRTDGIDRNLENRFFFEDEGHVRRLNTKQLHLMMKSHGFNLQNGFYSNQYYGAIKWITQSTLQFILTFADPKKAIDKKSYRFLFNLKVKLLFLFFLQLPSSIYYKLKMIRSKKIKHYMLWGVVIIPHFISYSLYSMVNTKSRNEWRNSKDQMNGSEMYLFFSRNSS